VIVDSTAPRSAASGGGPGAQRLAHLCVAGASHVEQSRSCGRDREETSNREEISIMIKEELEHLLELDPVKAHDAIMRATRPPPMIIHKEYTGKQPQLIPDDSDQPPLFSDEQIDVVAQALADLRIEMRGEFQDMVDTAVGPLTEAVAVLQGQVSVLMNLIGSLVNNNTVKEASETKTKTVRRVRQIESKPR
jgi:hypothetical protein